MKTAESALRFLVLNGPNLNLLGAREPAVYGATTLPALSAALDAAAAPLGVTLEHFQSNHEGALIDRLHAAAGAVQGVIINPGGLTHTSVALRDAFAATGLPFVEVHISNVFAREPFRHHSFLSPLAAGVVVGFGVNGYTLALHGLLATAAGRG